MNLDQLSKQLGHTFRLRPLPFRIGLDGSRLAPLDNPWRLDSVLRDPSRLLLVSCETGQALELQADNVHEYRSPEFLMLRCQLTLTPTGIGIEPIHKGAPIRPEPEVLAAVLKEINSAPLLTRQAVESGFRGLPVRSTGVLGSLTPVPPKRIRVGLMIEPVEDLFFEVGANAYPQLQLARRGISLTVVGSFRGRELGGVWLDDAIIER